MNAMIETPTDTVRVVYGASSGWFPLAGQTVRDIWAALAEPFGIPNDAFAFVNGERGQPSQVLAGGDVLEFIQASGVKGTLDPDEKAQMDRIESLLSRLVGEYAQAAKPPSAPKERPGRKPETLEIAEYANELRLQEKSWKQVFSACKKRWAEDQRVRNVRQIRATWDRHFGRQRNQH